MRMQRAQSRKEFFVAGVTLIVILLKVIVQTQHPRTNIAAQLRQGQVRKSNKLVKSTLLADAIQTGRHSQCHADDYCESAKTPERLCLTGTSV